MITVSKLAGRFGLSRSTLLYYDRIGLLRPAGRSDAGYRLYGERDVDRLRAICAYRDAGLPLDEIKSLLDAPGSPDEGILRNRLVQLDEEIGRLRSQQRGVVELLKRMGASTSSSALDKSQWVQILRSCGFSDDDMLEWHAQFERDAPSAHHAFLKWLGIAEEEVSEIRTRSSLRRRKRA